MAAPSIRVNGGVAGVKASSAATTAVTATLDSTDGVRQVTWSVLATDETSAAASYTLVQSGSVGQNVAFTSLGAGTAMLLKAVINAGVDPQTGQSNATTTSGTVKVYVPTAAGFEVGCAGEQYESDATFGATGIINSGVRAIDSVSPSGVPIKIVKVATTAALPANTRTGNVLTADINGAFAAIDGVTLIAGERFLAKDEGGGASHVNNGPYTLTTVGNGGAPWTATRAVDWDASSELVQGTAVRIQQGTVYGGQTLVYRTAGATINVTAQEFSPDSVAPATAQFVCLTANALLSNETALDAITTTVPFVSTTTTPLSLSRTDAATAATVNVATCIASSGGTTAAGFGPSVTFQAKQGSGSTETVGRMDVVWTDVTGSSEDTKFVFRTRVAGAAVTTGDHPELSAGGSSIPVTAASAGAKTLALTMRRRTGGTGQTNDGGYISFTIPDSASTETEAARLGWSWQNVTGTYGEVTLGVRNNLGLGSQYTFDSGGKLTTTNLAATGLSAAGLVTNSAAGLLSTSATAVLCNGTVPANLTAGVNIGALGSQLQFNRTDETPVVLNYTTTAAPGTVVDALALYHLDDSGVGANNGGVGAGFWAFDAGGDTVSIGRIAATMTDATSSAHDSQVAIQIAVAGALTDAVVMSTAETEITSDVTTWIVGRAAPYNGADATGAVSIDFSRSNAIEVGALVDNVTFTITGAVRGAHYTVVVRQHASAAKTTTWASGLFASGDDAIGTTVNTYTAWQFIVTDTGAIVCIGVKKDIVIP